MSYPPQGSGFTGGTVGAATTFSAGVTASSTLEVTGATTLSDGVSHALNTITGNTTLDSTYYVVLCNATSGGFTVTLPTCSSNSGRVYHIKKTDSSVNVITIDGNSSETIDGLTTYGLTSQYESITIISDGSNWYII